MKDLTPPPMADTAHFESRTSRFSKVRRSIANQTLGLKLTFRALTAGVAGLILLSGWLPNAFVNLSLFAAMAVYVVALAVRYVLRRTRFVSSLREAFIMESLAGTLNSRLISALDFSTKSAPSSLQKLVIHQASQDLDLDFESMLNRETLRRWAKRTGGLALVCVLLAIPLGRPMMENLRSAWYDAYNTLFPVTYTLTPDPAVTHILNLSETIDLGITFNRDSVKETTLILQAGEDDPEKIHLDVVDRHATYTLSSRLPRDYSAVFAFANKKTEAVKIVFTSNPVLENMQVELIYPTYTRLLPKSLEGIQPRIVGLTGTRVSFGFSFSKEISRATFTWDDGSEPLDLDVLGRFASISLIHSQARVARLQVEDIHGLKMEVPLLISFDVQRDEKPQIKLPNFLKNDMPLKIDEAKSLSFGARLQDDFGVQRCVLSWRKTSVENPQATLDRGEFERMVAPSRPKAIVDFAKVFESIPLVPGDRILFQVIVYDNHRPEAQSSKSSMRSFFIFNDELDDWSLKQAGFGGKKMIGKMRIQKAKRDTTVKNPEGLRTQEKFQNEFDAENASKAKTATIRGKFKQATSNYFKLMTEISNQEGGDE